MGRRALTRGAVVVVLSDGFERGDPELLAGRDDATRAAGVRGPLWVNPLKGHEAYEPLGGGMQAALPWVDRLVTGHDVASLDALGRILGGIDRRHVA